MTFCGSVALTEILMVFV